MLFCVFFGSLPVSACRSSMGDAVSDRCKLRRFYPQCNLKIKCVFDASTNSH